MSIDDVPHYTADDLPLRIPVEFEPGAPISALTGGSAVIIATMGQEVVFATSVTVAADEVAGQFEADTLAAGVWDVQVRVTVGAYSKTVSDFRIVVKQSH